VFAELARIPRGLLMSFDWSGNRINSALFEFLTRNCDLQTLTFQGCFHEQNVVEIGWLATFLTRENPPLRRLEIIGDKKCWLGARLSSVLTAIMNRNTPIEHLDVTYNRGREIGFTTLTEMVFASGSRLKSLVIDGMKPGNPQSLIDFLRRASQVPDLALSFPHCDLTSLLSHNKITKEVFVDLQQRFKLPAVEKGFFASGLTVFRYMRKQFIPLYVTEHDLEAIQRESPSVREPQIDSPDQLPKAEHPEQAPLKTPQTEPKGAAKKRIEEEPEAEYSPSMSESYQSSSPPPSVKSREMTPPRSGGVVVRGGRSTRRDSARSTKSGGIVTETESEVDWRFPVEFKYVWQDARTREIEEECSTEAFVELALRDYQPRERARSDRSFE
jgi:hypothetical protein